MTLSEFKLLVLQTILEDNMHDVVVQFEPYEDRHGRMHFVIDKEPDNLEISSAVVGELEPNGYLNVEYAPRFARRKGLRGARRGHDRWIFSPAADKWNVEHDRRFDSHGD